jgi:diadenosine tetraphosphate (Ap4A) HIT family hydrolase
VHERYQCKRVNVAAIGNLVPQLHLHIVGRREDDPCWPGVVWGQDLPEAAWSSDTLTKLIEELATAFSLARPADQ